MAEERLVAAIDALLPQTQCGLCGYNGCKPYAQAIATNQAAINKCPPGGLKTLEALAQLLQLDLMAYQEELVPKLKPPSKVSIREAECIGCAKCIQACPVDAIIGSAKRMHIVIQEDCTGCNLCIEPCPVDCIDIVPAKPIGESEQKLKADYWRKRYQQKQLRDSSISEQSPTKEQQQLTSQALIEAAIYRAREKGN